MFSGKLSNGVRYAAEPMPGFRSVSMGVWINAGSVYERGGESGLAHFIEHMLFKGTANASAAEIAERMDAVGGNLNAFTAKECTCFYGRVLENSMGVLASTLADMLTDPLLDPGDIGREQGVVIQEISMTEDSPEDLVTDTAFSLYYEGDPLARPILGTRESVRSFTREGLVSYLGRLYNADNMVISAAGCFTEEELVSVLEASFGRLPRGASPAPDFGRHAPGKRLKVIRKDIEQVHICINLPGFSKDQPQNWAQLLFSNAFGGTMSSRLFQSVRERSGLAYSVYSYPTAYENSGFITLYAGAGPENAVRVTELILGELGRVKRDCLTNEELARAKDQLTASYLMARESTSSRGSALGRTVLSGRRVLTEDETVQKIAAVTMDDIASILPVVCCTDDMSSCAVGRTDGAEAELRALLN